MTARCALASLASLLAACSATRTLLPVADADTPPPVAPDAGALDSGALDTGPAPRPTPPSCAAGEPPGPAPLADAVAYEVFVRGFRDGDADGIGDLPGLTAKLDYLNDGDPATTGDLGVTALWLMPIHPSPSYHGYDVTDYRAVNPEYGTLADLDALTAAASKRGIRVILDLVANHTSNLHPWFQASKSSPDSSKRSWYVWRSDAPAWGRPWDPKAKVWHPAKQAYYYGVFSPDMPDLNYDTPDVRTEMLSVADFWVGHGVSGFRLDGARYLVETGPGEGQADTPGTHAFWKALRAHLAATHPEVLLVGEVWTDVAKAATYVASDELHMVFGFDRAAGLRDALRLGLAAPLAGKACGELDTLPTSGLGSFSENHDLDRLATEVPGDVAALRLAAALLLTLPGTPFLYYGQELGMANDDAPGDMAKRGPMPWTESAAGVAPVSAQAADPDSLLSLYRQLVRLRSDLPALSRGGMGRIPVTSGGGAVLAYLRTTAASRALVVANLGRKAVDGVVLDLGGAGLPSPLKAVSRLGRTIPGPVGGAGSWPLGSLGPREFAVVELMPGE